MSKREVLDEELLENIPLELTMEEEMPALDRLLDAETELPNGEKGVATQAVATQLDANGEGGNTVKGGRRKGITVGTLARGCPSQ